MALWLHADRRVAAERLIVDLWGPEAGAAAVKRLQVEISRLRRALSDPSADAQREPVMDSGAGSDVLRASPAPQSLGI